MQNAHPCFPLKDLGKKVHITHGKPQYLGTEKTGQRWRALPPSPALQGLVSADHRPPPRGGCIGGMVTVLVQRGVARALTREREGGLWGTRSFPGGKRPLFQDRCAALQSRMFLNHLIFSWVLFFFFLHWL